MKIFYATIVHFLLTICVSAQISNGISYQTIIRNSNGDPLPDQPVNLQISVIKGGLNGEIIYTEIHNVQTNAVGMAALVIGSGLPQFGTFNQIQWGASKHFFQLAADFDGNDSYQVIGTAQFIDVPYAINSKSLMLTDPKGNQWNITVDTLGNLIPVVNDWQCGLPFIDERDGKSYATIPVGDHCWMAENLNFGQMILSSVPQTDNDVVEKYCWENNESNCGIYGGLYTWDEMMNYVGVAGSQGICPTNGGWHIPADDDWDALIGFLGGHEIAGGKMKTTGTIQQGTGLWSEPNEGATNQSGFSGLPAGFTNLEGLFINLSFYAYFWASNEFQGGNAWSRGLSYLGTSATRYANNKQAGFSVRCVRSQGTQIQLPTVSTLPVTNILTTQATGGGEVSDDGNGVVIERGLCWSAETIPTLEINDGSMMCGNGLGKFYGVISGLEQGTEYNIRAYAINCAGTAYGDVLTFTTGMEGQPCPGMPTITDNQGNVYNTVLIGEQCWIKENLRIGSMIDGSSDQTNNGLIEKYCYDNNPDNCLISGGLYQWGELMQYQFTSGAKGICPQGWHIPTDYDLKMLEAVADSQFGLNSPVWDETGWRGFDAGKNLKSTNGWTQGGNGMNSYGFNTLPAGMREYTGNFTGQASAAGFWTSTASSEGKAWNRLLEAGQDMSGRFESIDGQGMSVRCVRDSN
ncbi:MAG TPA: FISUMP domain-containing protein [Bacteroidales bacterium]|nr:FISUMP domain-containing protein [Bacteroidales bacterium]